MLGHCTDDDPAHPGKLDSSQQFQLGVNGEATVLKSVAAGLCLDPSATSDPEGGMTSKLLVPCATAGLWYFDAHMERVTSQAQHACVAPSHKGKQCHVCLDVNTKGGIDLWDCKPKPPGGGGKQDNQAFTRLAEEQGLKHSGLCLTVGNSNAGAGAEVSAYGSVSFLSNMGDSDVPPSSLRAIRVVV